MAHSENRCVAEIDESLARDLPVLNQIAVELGASSVSVVLLRTGKLERLVYCWPALNREQPIDLSHMRVDALESQSLQPVSAEDPLNNLFTSLAANARSFLVSSCGRDLQAVVAYGFEEPNPPVPQACCTTGRMSSLVGLAVWCVQEIHSLRRQLAVVGERLGGRKIVEQAKGILQAKHGITEQEAYEYLRKLSRQRRAPMAAVAKSLLRTVD